MAHILDTFAPLENGEACRRLSSDPRRGLDEEEAALRLAREGANRLPDEEESAFHRIFRRFWGPIPWMIEAAALLAAVAGKWEEFSIILVMLLINVTVEFWQESRAQSALALLKGKLSRKALVLREGRFREVPAAELVAGDVVKLKIGDVVPADAKLLEGEYLSVDQSSLTGESLPAEKEPGGVVYANSAVKSGEMTALVVATGTRTYFGSTVALVEKAGKEEKSHFQKAVLQIGNYLILVTAALAGVILTVGLFRQEPLAEIVLFLLVLVVASIPVALPAVLSVTMAVGALKLAKKEAIVSRLAAVEELAGVDVLCSDKTGTLTQNRMNAGEPLLLAAKSPERLFQLAVLASSPENKDPLEAPLFAWMEERDVPHLPEGYYRSSFLPFDPVRKRTEGVYETREGTLRVTKGAPQAVAALAEGDPNLGKLEAAVEEQARKGYRTIAVASAEGNLPYRLEGLIPLFDPPREDSAATVEETRRLGVEVKMVTGDNTAIARQVSALLGLGEGIRSARELKGGDHRELSLLARVVGEALYRKLEPKGDQASRRRFTDELEAELEKELERIPLPKGYVKRHESEIREMIESADGFSQVFPEDKYLIVEKLQQSGKIVAMTGDGVNDAPALKKADAGIAVSGATDAARAAADLVLLSPGLSVITDALKLARATFERMRSYSLFRIAETIRLILFMSAAILAYQFYPVTPVMIILLALLNDLPIMAIAYDRTGVSPVPVRWNMPEILTVATVLGVLGVFSSFGIFYVAESLLQMPRETVQTFIFLKLAVAGHLTIFVARTEGAFWKPPYPAPLLLAAGGTTMAAATLFAVNGWLVAPIGWHYALLVWGYALAWLFFNDGVKRLLYRTLRRRGNGE